MAKKKDSFDKDMDDMVKRFDQSVKEAVKTFDNSFPKTIQKEIKDIQKELGVSDE